MQGICSFRHLPGYLQTGVPLAEELPDPADLLLVRPFLGDDLRQIGDLDELVIGDTRQQHQGCGSELNQRIVLDLIVRSHGPSKKILAEMFDKPATYPG